MASSSGPSLSAKRIPLWGSSNLFRLPASITEIANVENRKYSSSSLISTSSSIADFLEAKLDDAEADVKHLSTLREIAGEAVITKTPTSKEFQDVAHEIQTKSLNIQNEIRVVKKQRKFVVVDLEELTAGDVLEDLKRTNEQYAKILVKCVECASSNWASPRNNERGFRERVCQRLEAIKWVPVPHSRKGRMREDAVWCHVLGE